MTTTALVLPKWAIDKGVTPEQYQQYLARKTAAAAAPASGPPPSPVVAAIATAGGAQPRSPEDAAALAALPPRLQAQVASGAMTLAGATNRQAMFKAGQLPAQLAATQTGAPAAPAPAAPAAPAAPTVTAARPAPAAPAVPTTPPRPAPAQGALPQPNVVARRQANIAAMDSNATQAQVAPPQAQAPAQMEATPQPAVTPAAPVVPKKPRPTMPGGWGATHGGMRYKNQQDLMAWKASQ